MKRLMNATETARDLLGVSPSTFRLMRKEDKNFPKPVRNKFWDSKQIENYLDKLCGIKSELDYNQTILARLNGDDSREIPSNS